MCRFLYGFLFTLLSPLEQEWKGGQREETKNCIGSIRRKVNTAPRGKTHNNQFKHKKEERNLPAARPSRPWDSVVSVGGVWSAFFFFPFLPFPAPLAPHFFPVGVSKHDPHQACPEASFHTRNSRGVGNGWIGLGLNTQICNYSRIDP